MVEWRRLIELNLGLPVEEIASDIVEEPDVLEVKTREVTQAEQEVSELRLSHELGLAVTAQCKFLAIQKQIYDDLKTEFDQTPLPPATQDAVIVFESELTQLQLTQHIDAQTEEYLDLIDGDHNLRDGRYLGAALERLELINATDAATLGKQAGDMGRLYKAIQELQGNLDRASQTCRDALNKAVVDEATFMRVREAAQTLLGADVVNSIEVEQAGAQPSVGMRLRALFRNDHGKEVDQRRRLIAALVDRSEVIAEDAPRWNPPRLPNLPEYNSSRS